MSKRKICVVTGTRAEYGLLYWLMKSIQKDSSLELQVVVTGMHLSPEFGLTYQQIEQDGFQIDKKIEMVLSADTSSSISKSTGLGLIGFADAYAELQPDMIVLIGDRYEILAGSMAAMFARMPIAHIHGGETTEGAFDEAIRHSITKMAWWHFVAAAEYQKRVIQLGEDPSRVFLVGGLGVDGIKKMPLLQKAELEKQLDFTFGEKNLLVTYHPVTLETNSSQKQFQTVLDYLKSLADTKIIFTFANADTHGRVINSMIERFVQDNSDRTVCFHSMGQLKYWSALQFVDAIVGNSSSGLAEGPTFKTGTINIGKRQAGRLKASSVIDCEPEPLSLQLAFNRLYSAEFQEKLPLTQNPYGEGDATEKIFAILKHSEIPNAPIKKFYDL